MGNREERNIFASERCETEGDSQRAYVGPVESARRGVVSRRRVASEYVAVNLGVAGEPLARSSLPEFGFARRTPGEQSLLAGQQLKPVVAGPAFKLHLPAAVQHLGIIWKRHRSARW